MLGVWVEVQTMQEDAEIQRKAQRAKTILYVVTAVMIALPVVLWWLFGS
jgi:hypothetical protein